jgi:hypothetical protein
VINADKTQLIIFKSPRKKLPDGYKLDVGGVSLLPTIAAQLLGFTLDRHLNFGNHISLTVKKCNGVLGVLARPASYLPRDLLKLAYIALVRSHLLYCSAIRNSACSAIRNSASKTHLHKLDEVQKKASRINCPIISPARYTFGPITGIAATELPAEQQRRAYSETRGRLHCGKHAPGYEEYV